MMCNDQLQPFEKKHATTNFLLVMTRGLRNFDKGNPEVYPNCWTMQSKIAARYLHYVAATSTLDHPGFVAPVGMVLQIIYNDILGKGQDPTMAGSFFHELYKRHGSHPGLEGSYV
jgi:hypothetical protein